MVKNPFRRRKKATPSLLVMAVGDDKEVLSSMSSVLQGAGYVVHAMASVPAAVTLLDAIEMPTAFIGDFRSPDTDGREFMTKIGIRFGKAALPPVIFLMDTPEDEAVARTLGVDDVLPKPVDPETLLRYIKALVERAQSL